MNQSQRMARVQAPIIPIIGELVRDHPGTISFGQGVTTYPPPPQVREWIDAFWQKPGNHQYKLVHGIPELKERIAAKLYAENGIQVKEHSETAPNHLCVTAGGNMAFANVVFAVCDEGDEVILLTPFYFNHEMAVQLAGAKAVRVKTDEYFQPVLENISAAISSKTRAVVTVSPNNPSGAVYSQETLEQINQLCGDMGIYHIHDEVYEYFTYVDAVHFSPGRISGAERHTISLFSLSKAYGFASWRIGYMVYPEHLDEAVRKIQDTQLICPPVISQYAAIGAMEAGRAYCTERLKSIESVRNVLVNGLNELGQNGEAIITQGAFYFLLKVPVVMNEMELLKHLVKEFGVAAIPGQCFGLTEGCYLRLSYGALDQNTAEEGIARLTHGIKTIAGATA